MMHDGGAAAHGHFYCSLRCCPSMLPPPHDDHLHLFLVAAASAGIGISCPTSSKFNRRALYVAPILRAYSPYPILRRIRAPSPTDCVTSALHAELPPALPEDLRAQLHGAKKQRCPSWFSHKVPAVRSAAYHTVWAPARRPCAPEGTHHRHVRLVSDVEAVLERVADLQLPIGRKDAAASKAGEHRRMRGGRHKESGYDRPETAEKTEDGRCGTPLLTPHAQNGRPHTTPFQQKSGFICPQGRTRTDGTVLSASQQWSPVRSVRSSRIRRRVQENAVEVEAAGISGRAPRSVRFETT